MSKPTLVPIGTVAPPGDKVPADDRPPAVVQLLVLGVARGSNGREGRDRRDDVRDGEEGLRPFGRDCRRRRSVGRGWRRTQGHRTTGSKVVCNRGGE